jgi:hypothetical protein
LLKDLVANLFYTLNTQDYPDTLTLEGNLFQRFEGSTGEVEEAEETGEAGEMGNTGEWQNLW